MKSLEKSKDEYIAKLKTDLATVEGRYMQLLNETHM